MDSFRGFESGSVCDTDDIVEGTEWNKDYPSDRCLVNSLLEASEEWFSKDQDADDFGSHIGWEEAVSTIVVVVFLFFELSWM